MAATEGTDARVLAGAILLSSMAVCVVGLTTVPDAPFVLTAGSLIPPLLGVAGFLVMMLVVDPILTPKRRPTRDDIHIWLSKTFLCRLPVVEVPALAGLVIAMIERERSVLLLGALGSLVLASVWWPGEQFFSAMRRRLQPMSVDNMVDELLNTSNGHLTIRTR